MDNSETPSTLVTQGTGQRPTKQKQHTTQHNTPTTEN